MSGADITYKYEGLSVLGIAKDRNHQELVMWLKETMSKNDKKKSNKAKKIKSNPLLFHPMLSDQKKDKKISKPPIKKGTV